MRRVVESDNALFHSTDRAIEAKLCCKRIDHSGTLSKRERKCGEILHKRDFLRRFPEVNAEGRIASYDYLGVKRWYDQNGVDEDGFYSDGESATEGEFNRDGWRYEKRPGMLRKRIFGRENQDANKRDEEKEKHEAVALAQELLEMPGVSFGQFAKENGMTKDEVITAVELAKKVMPDMEPALREHADDVSRRMWAILCKNRELLIAGDWSLKQFWEKMQNLDFSDFIELIGAEQILKCIVREMGGEFNPKNPKAIHVLAQATGTMYYSEFSKRIDQLAKALSSIGKGRDFAAMRKYSQGFRDIRVDLLLSESFSIDGGKTMVKITEADVKKAEAKIRKDGGLICRRTVHQEILDMYR